MSRPTIVRPSRAEIIRAGGASAVLQPAGSPRAGSKHSSYRRIAAAGKLGTALRSTLAGAFVLAALSVATPGAHAQGLGAFTPGDAVVTGFSGAVGPAEGENPLDHTYIDPDGASVRVIALAATGGAAEGQVVPAPRTFQVTAGQVGQVFGVALDDGVREDGQPGAPNAYVAATSAYGLAIVGADGDGDGAPDRARTGQAGASWMAGQFGTEGGGGPGSVWKIDGVTGEVSLFAEITLDGVANSGPGLGNIAFDSEHRQLFVSDLDTGMIVRVDLDGTVLDHFDHGVEARAAAGLEQVAFDPANRLDINSPAFNSEDPETWQLTEARRRVHGLAVQDGRLYYSVAEGPQIWSVGLAEDGGFGDDARAELDLSGQVVPFPVTDLAFGANGSLMLAQRGANTGSYDFRTFTVPGQARVLRFDRDEVGNWQPAPSEYAVGFTGEYRNASGGIALGNGYDAEGNIDLDAFARTLWSTGDGLLGDVAPVSGLQGNDVALVRPHNEPPAQSYFLDLDEKYDDAEETGQAGDVEIVSFGSGEPGIAEGPGFPGYTPIDTPGDDVPGFGDPGFPPPPVFPLCPPGQKWNPITQSCHPIIIKLCPPGKKWNPVTKKCDQIIIKLCPPGMKWNPVLKKCVPIKILCPDGTKWNPVTKKCEPIVIKICPIGQKWNPILKKCVPIIKLCPLGKKWNPVTKKCEPFVIKLCPVGQKWNPVLKKCVPIIKLCPLGKKWNPVTKKCEPFVIKLCPVGQKWNPVLKKCVPIIKICPLGKKWNPVTKKCEPFVIKLCPVGQKWNPVLKKCVPICPLNKKWNPITKKCEPFVIIPVCPKWKKWNPILKKCVPTVIIDCAPGFKLDPVTNKCLPICKPGHKWNPVTKKCTPIIVIQPKCPAGTKWSANLKKCIPMIKLPIACKAGTKWSATLKKCVPVIKLPKLCPAGKKWNPVSKKCVASIIIKRPIAKQPKPKLPPVVRIPRQPKQPIIIKRPIVKKPQPKLPPVLRTPRQPKQPIGIKRPSRIHKNPIVIRKPIRLRPAPVQPRFKLAPGQSNMGRKRTFTVR